MTNESQQRLVQTLRMQNNHINALLESKTRDESNFHLVLAGDLRSMLCDKDYPTLLTLAEELLVDLCLGAILTCCNKFTSARLFV